MKLQSINGGSMKKITAAEAVDLYYPGKLLTIEPKYEDNFLG